MMIMWMLFDDDDACAVIGIGYWWNKSNYIIWFKLEMEMEMELEYNRLKQVFQSFIDYGGNHVRDEELWMEIKIMILIFWSETTRKLLLILIFSMYDVMLVTLINRICTYKHKHKHCVRYEIKVICFPSISHQPVTYMTDCWDGWELMECTTKTAQSSTATNEAVTTIILIRNLNYVYII